MLEKEPNDLEKEVFKKSMSLETAKEISALNKKFGEQFVTPALNKNFGELLKKLEKKLEPMEAGTKWCAILIACYKEGPLSKDPNAKVALKELDAIKALSGKGIEQGINNFIKEYGKHPEAEAAHRPAP